MAIAFAYNHGLEEFYCHGLNCLQLYTTAYSIKKITHCYKKLYMNYVLLYLIMSIIFDYVHLYEDKSYIYIYTVVHGRYIVTWTGSTDVPKQLRGMKFKFSEKKLQS